MAYDGYSTPAHRPPRSVSLRINEGELDAIVRVLASGKRCTSGGLRRRLEWFYKFKGVPRPEERGQPSNIVRLSDYRAIRDSKRMHGAAVTALGVAQARVQSEFLVAIVERLEDEMECALEIERRRAERRRAPSKLSLDH